ncbi:MAG TPA: tripartite tricarboxylate transporter substrate binding protein [Burkholderiales bacterium]|nr:tripartite tricarboxylate transporter substrate binding protein [Burkholderiales bacterium]
MHPMLKFAAASCLLSAGAAHAQNYPTRLVRIIVPFVPGGPTDIQGRWAAQQLSNALGQNFIVENRGGGGGVPGTEAVVKAAPDGYTLLAGNPGPLTVSPSVNAKMPYDTLRDLAPIFLIARTASCLMVHPSVPAKGIKDFVALAKAQPGKINYGSPGVGTVGHFATELFATQAGIKMNHVPYKGAAQYTIDLIAGHIEIAIIQFAGCAPLLQQNKLRAIGATSEKRSPLLPNLPTIAEQGLTGFVSYNWNGMLAPAKTPREVITRLHDVLAKQLAAPEHRDSFINQGHEVGGLGPDEYANFIRAEIEKWARVAKAAGIQRQ